MGHVCAIDLLVI